MEIIRRQENEECSYCKERESKKERYAQEIELEKVRECQKALEREKIAKGIFCTKRGELRLREIQKMQMIEKKNIEIEEDRVEKMWHQVLVDDVKRKELLERREFERRKQEMLERRRTYDEQIASANRARQKIVQQEREKENRRLEKMRIKMEQDHYGEIKKKKEQQLENWQNFLEGHEMKMGRLNQEKAREREIDIKAAKAAEDELKRERIRKRALMDKLQMQERIFVHNFDRERQMAQALEEDTDRVVNEWKRDVESKTDEYFRKIEDEKQTSKKKAAEEYKKFIKEKNDQSIKEREDRSQKMARVRRSACNELRLKLDGAKVELKKQLDYRDGLNSQIRANQRFKETQLQDIEMKQRPFTRKPEMFKQAMERVDKSPGRTSTNPVHPFRRVLEKEENDSNSLILPLL